MSFWWYCLVPGAGVVAKRQWLVPQVNTKLFRWEGRVPEFLVSSLRRWYRLVPWFCRLVPGWRERVVLGVKFIRFGGKCLVFRLQIVGSGRGFLVPAGFRIVSLLGDCLVLDVHLRSLQGQHFVFGVNVVPFGGRHRLVFRLRGATLGRGGMVACLRVPSLRRGRMVPQHHIPPLRGRREAARHSLAPLGGRQLL